MALVPLLGEMDLEEFRIRGRQLVEWIADYLDNPERYPVFSRSQPGDISLQLPQSAPEDPESMADILADFERILLPGITHWNHPGFFAYFGISGSGPGILGEFLSSALNVNAMLWHTSPAATELETVTLDWLRQMLDLPPEFKGIINDTASISSLLAIAAARESLDLDIRRLGMAGRPELPRLRLYTSEQSHSSIEKAAITLGIGQDGVRKVPVDQQFRMDVEALGDAIKQDSEEGWRPFCVVATVGTTSTTSIDPVPEIAALCEQLDLWLHVDAAYGGVAAIVPEFRHVLDGVSQADSIVVNPHKWLFTPVDCSAFFVRNPEMLTQTFSLVPEYLRSSHDDVTNYMDWGIQLGRRFRALKLWMVIRHFGIEGIQARVSEHIRLAQMMGQRVDDDPGYERMAPTPFSVVCLRAVPADLAETLNTSDDEGLIQEIELYLDELNRSIVDSVSRSGEVYFSHTMLNGKFTIRMAIGNIRSDEKWIVLAWDLLKETANSIDATLRPDSLRS
jgi:aromatic-L-amino-acid decarboxylase